MGLFKDNLFRVIQNTYKKAMDYPGDAETMKTFKDRYPLNSVLPVSMTPLSLDYNRRLVAECDLQSQHLFPTRQKRYL